MKRLFTPLAVGTAAWLLVACGGGDSPGSTSADAQRATDSAYRTAAPAGTTASRLDARLKGAQGQVRVWVSLEQNSVATQRATLAEADALLASDRKAIKSAPSLRAGVAEHRMRIRDAQGALTSRLESLGGKVLARVQNAHNAVAGLDGEPLSLLQFLHRAGILCGIGAVMFPFHGDWEYVLQFHRLPAQDPQVGEFDQPHGFVHGLGVVVQAEQPPPHFLRELRYHLKNMLAPCVVRNLHALE